MPTPYPCYPTKWAGLIVQINLACCLAMPTIEVECLSIEAIENSSNPMSEHLNNVQWFDMIEAERQRLALQIDQELIAQIQLLNSQINAYEVAATPQQRQAFAVLASMMRDLLQRTLDLQTSLHPSTLATLGLIATLETMTNRIQRNTGVQFTVHLAHLESRLPYRTELALYRGIEDLLLLLIANRCHSIELTTRTLGQALSIDIRHDVHPLPTNLADEVSLPMDCTLAQPEDGRIHLRVELTAHSTLTNRERDVLALVAQGMTNKQVAAQLKIRPRTVKYHLDNIFAKLNASSRTEAVTIAIQRDLLSSLTNWAGRT